MANKVLFELLYWVVSKSTHFELGILLFCFVVEYFGLMRLKCHRYMYKICDSAKARSRLRCWI